MTYETAYNAIQGILEACNAQTRMRIREDLAPDIEEVPVSSGKPIPTIEQATEHLLRILTNGKSRIHR